MTLLNYFYHSIWKEYRYSITYQRIIKLFDSDVASRDVFQKSEVKDRD